MYDQVLDLYGDRGNIAALRYRCEERGIDFDIDSCDIGDGKIDFSQYNLIFIGGGADYEQSMVAKDLRSRKMGIVDALENGAFALLICGGYQLFGQYYIDSSGNKISGLGVFDYYTKAAEAGKRCIGNVLIEAELEADGLGATKILGFENHGGQTYGVENPFGRVLYGNGNHFEAGLEGIMTDSLIGTYLHGPLLPKNPILTDFIIKKGLRIKELEPLDNSLENRAFNSIYKALL